MAMRCEVLMLGSKAGKTAVRAEGSFASSSRLRLRMALMRKFVGEVRGGAGMPRRTRILKMLGIEGEKWDVRSGWKWVMLKRSLRVSERAMSSIGWVCSCDFHLADLEYWFAWRAMAALMLSARWWSRTSCG